MTFIAKTKAWLKAKFKLVDNWRQVLLRSYAVWLAVGATLFGSIEYWHADLMALMPIAFPFVPERVAGAISTIMTAAIPFARIKKQVSIAIEEATKTVVDVNVDILTKKAAGSPDVIAEVNVTQKTNES